jgi:predicted nucleic acid-binding protein
VADVVLDASAGAEILADTDIGTSLAGLLPAPTLFWVPDGVFDVEVGAVLRRWDLRNSLPVETISTARNLLAQTRLRRISVRALSERAWQLRANITFPDACYVALAEALGCPLVTTDMRLVRAPNLPVATLHLGADGN